MRKEEILSRILDAGLVAIVRTDSAEKAERIADACIEGGVAALEITFSVPGCARVIEKLAARYQSGEIVLGAGTVLDPETARVAMLSGAQYIITPYLSPATVRLCNRYRVPVMPGCQTVRECVEAMELGVDVIKLFPGEVLGPGAIKAIRAPLPQANLMPVGGVSLDNVREWISAGACAVAVGGGLTAAAKDGEYGLVAERAREFLRRIRDARA